MFNNLLIDTQSIVTEKPIISILWEPFIN